MPEVEFCGQILGKGVRRTAPGKLLAIEKVPVPKDITHLRSFLGLTNYYSSYVEDYAKMVARLQDKLKVPREIGKKGSKVKIDWSEEDQAAFDLIKQKLCAALELQRVNPDKPFVLRVDASEFAIDAVLEQLIDENRNPSEEDVRRMKTAPIAFMSRKLAANQRNWVVREKDTYAIKAELEE